MAADAGRMGARLTVPFDEGWTVFVGELDPDVPRNTAKTATAGGPSDLTRAEGADPPIPEKLAQLLGGDLAGTMFNVVAELGPGWTAIDLPDDWTTRTAARPPATVRRAAGFHDDDVRSGYLPTGVAWYRKVFDVAGDWDGRRVTIELDGVMRDAHVWVNGSFVGSHYSGYVGFALDVTELLRYGDEGSNVILVRTDTRSTEGWWAEGGGIYRHVRLVATAPVHIARHGLFVRTERLESSRATVRIDVDLVNEETAPAGGAIVECTITTPRGNTVVTTCAPVDLDALGETTVRCAVELSDPVPWSPSSPARYRLDARLRLGDEVVDDAATRFGVRTVAYGPQGLVLNGEPLRIRGTCNHQDFAGVGIAVPDRVHRYKVARLKELGANAYRCAHHAPAPEILDACDELGLLVLDENRRLESNADGLADLTELIRRDRNHPSVFMWCLENEELIAAAPMGRRLLRRLVDVARHLDPSRPTTVAGQFAKHDDRYLSIPDVAGFNYDSGDAARYREATGDAPVIATEDASFVSSRGEYDDQPDLGLCSSHDTGSFFERMAAANGVDLTSGTAGGAVETRFGHLASSWLHSLDHPYLGGVFVWTGFDYRGEAVPFGWPAVTSAFGLMDMCGFPKDVAHYWRSRWSDAPVVHLLPDWNRDVPSGAPVRVDVYTNCEAVELVLNGRSLGTAAVARDGVVQRSVDFEPGTLAVHAYRGGEVVATATRVTTGAPSAIRLDTDVPWCTADGHDVVIVRAAIVDADGRVVPNAEPMLEFSADQGASILGTGNGSPADPTPASASRRAAFHGLALAIVRGPRAPGPFSVEATSPGHHTARLELRAEPEEHR